MNGQLWQPCTRRGCDTEPVCVDCMECERHCRCQPPPTADELAAKRAAFLAERTAKRGILTYDKQLSSPLDVRNEAQADSLIGDVLAREPIIAPRFKREPMTTREQVLDYLAAHRDGLHWDSDWYAVLQDAGAPYQREPGAPIRFEVPKPERSADDILDALLAGEED